MTRNKRSYYETLGVDRSVSADELKRAYRRLAKQYHPDRNADDPKAEDRFKELQQAYAILKDPAKRSEYDRFGEAGVGNWAANDHGERVYQWGSGASVSVDDLEDLMSAFGGQGHARSFDDIFGHMNRGRTATRMPQRGADMEHAIALSFDQAIAGSSVSVTLRSKQTGSAEELEVKIPAGVTHGQRIRVRGKGQPGQSGGPPGNLFLVCSVAPHPYFRRQGADIHLEVPVTVSEASLGAKIDVPTLNGMATITLPPGTAGGTKLRLKGKGVSADRGASHGDQIVAIRIVPPTKINEHQRRLLEELRALDTTDPRAGCPWNTGGDSC